MAGDSEQHPSAVSGALGRPFTEQVAFFRRKLGNQVPTRRWDDITGAAHDDAFMVAGAVKADMLSDLAAAVDKAIVGGRGIEEFRRDFRAIVKRHGWTGWAGEGSTGGEAWRVGVIYRTNSYTSYAAGRYAQLQAGKFPWWVYRHGGSLEPRPQHLSWDGIPLPPDHPFWKTHYPPSDWGCSCYVVGARSTRGIKRVGGVPGKSLPDGWNTRDPKTGAPPGIGKGWDYAPGASVSETVQAMARKVGAWEYQIAKAFMDSLPAETADALADSYRALPSTADNTRRYAAQVLEPKPALPAPPARTLGRLRSDQARAIEAELGRSVEGFDFSLDPSAVGHVRGEHGDPVKEWRSNQRAVTIADFAQLPRIASAGELVRLPGKSDMGEDLFEQRLTIGNDTFVARWAARGRLRRTVALKTLFIEVEERGPKPTS